MNRAALHLSIALVVLLTPAAAAHAARAGTLDPGFGNGGIVQIDCYQGDDEGTSIALDSGGGLLVGSTGCADDGASVVTRLRADGRYDTAFGLSSMPGRARVLSQPSANGVNERSAAVGRLSNGLPVFASTYERDGTYRAHVGRCTDVRCPDTDVSSTLHFALGVQLVFPPAVLRAQVNTLHVDAHDNIVVGGHVEFAEPGSCSAWVARLSPDLVPDPAFGLPTYHVRILGFVDTCLDIKAVTVLDDGAIVAVGRAARGADPFDRGQFLVAKFAPDGSNAADFNGGAPRIFGFGDAPNEDVATAVAIDSQGRIVVAGYSQLNNSADYDYAVARLTPLGAFDTSFYGVGYRRVHWDNGGDHLDYASGVAVDAADRIVLAGGYRTADSDGAFGIGVARLTEAGDWDEDFADIGRAHLRVGPGSDDSAAAVVLDDRGRIVVAGTSADGDVSDGANAIVLRLDVEGNFRDGFE